MFKKKTAENVADKILESYNDFLAHVHTILMKEGKMSKQEIDQLLADKMIFLDLADRFIEIEQDSTMGSGRKKVSFSFTERMKGPKI